MSIWTPDDPIDAQITMKLESARFEKLQVEAKADRIMSRLDRTRGMMRQVEENLNFLNSRRAKTVLLIEYRNAKRGLAILRNEEAALLLELEMQEESHDRLASEIKQLEEESAKVGKILRFTRRDAKNEGSKD